MDFEATCDDDMKAKKMDHEIIEFPSVLLKYENDEVKIVSEFQMFCKPKFNPTLTPFCENLTGIKQEQVDKGVDFPVAFAEHYNWLRSCIPDFYKVYSEHRVFIVTCGRWDLEVMIPKEYNIWKLSGNQIPKIYTKFSNCKDEYKYFYNRTKVYGMTYMLNDQGIMLEGRHHSGIDDCRNIAKIVCKMIKDGHKPNMFNVTQAKISNKFLL